MPDFADIKSLLDVLHDPLAVALRARWKSFNPFRVLKAERRELKHTTTLAWLLDPRENHGLGDHFLRGFLKNACETAGDHTALLRYETDNDAIVRVHSELQMRKIEDKYIIPDIGGDTEVDGSAKATGRDERRIDVLVEGQGWAVAIEAKIGAGEGEEQLNDYRRTIHRWADKTGRELLLVYLTIDEQELEREGWINAQWSTSVAQPLRTVLDASGASAQLGDQQHAFLASYLDILSEIADDENGIVKRHLSELATLRAGTLRRLKEIIKASSGQNAEQNANWIVLYERNKPLLDRLLQYVDLGYELRARMIREAIASAGYRSVKDDNSYLRFITGDWAERFPKIIEPSDPRLPRVLYEIRNDSKTPQRVFVALQVWHLAEDKYRHEIHREDRVAMLRKIQNQQRAADFPRLFSKNVAKPQLNEKVQSLVSTPIACNIDALDMRHFADELNRFVTRTSKEIEPFLGGFRA
ncbi:PD-(D/E)XK nuclease family protein [Paraburkholderia fungorum]|uniref:PDDEXK-like family protein n=1 Tax=Paraburkholderia fungorum TaxID=134537 RepID=UPI0038BB5999